MRPVLRLLFNIKFDKKDFMFNIRTAFITAGIVLSIPLSYAADKANVQEKAVAAPGGPQAASLVAAIAGGLEQSRLDAFKTRLGQKFPMTADAVVKQAFGDFFSVVRGNEVLFVKEDLSILINGEVMDLQANRSLTSELRSAARPKINVAELDVRDAIKIGTGQDVLYVFSDPDCPFCRQVETELGKLQDVTVYVFPFPIAGLHPNATAVAESIWCSNDRAGAWRAYLTEGKQPAAANCANPIEKNIAAAKRFQLFGTPALVFSDGFVIPGAVPASVITAQIAASKKP